MAPFLPCYLTRLVKDRDILAVWLARGKIDAVIVDKILFLGRRECHFFFFLRLCNVNRYFSWLYVFFSFFNPSKTMFTFSFIVVCHVFRPFTTPIPTPASSRWCVLPQDSDHIDGDGTPVAAVGADGRSSMGEEKKNNKVYTYDNEMIYQILSMFKTANPDIAMKVDCYIRIYLMDYTYDIFFLVLCVISVWCEFQSIKNC